MEFSTAILIYSISVSVSSAAIRSTDGVCSEEATRIINAAPINMAVIYNQGLTFCHIVGSVCTAMSFSFSGSRFITSEVRFSK